MNAATVKSVAHVFSIVKRQKAQVVRLSAQVGQNHDAQVQQGAEHDEQDAVLKQLGSEVARPSEEIVSLKRTSTPNSDRRDAPRLLRTRGTRSTRLIECGWVPNETVFRQGSFSLLPPP